MTPSLNPDTSLSGRILVVDDEPSVLAIAAAILNTIEVTPLKARNGEEALATVQAHYASGQKVSLAIQDLTMPGGMSGFETMEALRTIDPNIRVIACSGFFQDGALELCQSIGFSNILAKPYTPDSLLGLIRRTLLEPPPPPVTKKQRSSEAANESPACFTPAASSTPIKPVAPSGFSLPQDDTDEEDEDEPACHPPTPQTHFAPSDPASYQTTPHAEYASIPTPTLVAEPSEPPSDSTTKTSPRRPAFLASALAKSIRNRLQPHHESADAPSMNQSAAQPLE